MNEQLLYRQEKIKKIDCIFPIWEEVGPISIHAAGLFTDIPEMGKREINESVNIVIGWVMKFSQTSIIPPLIHRYESPVVIAKHASFYLALKLV